MSDENTNAGNQYDNPNQEVVGTDIESGAGNEQPPPPEVEPTKAPKGPPPEPPPPEEPPA
jgi:hypothetical protein